LLILWHTNCENYARYGKSYQGGETAVA